MSDQLQPDADLAIAHVLFIDIVAYSKLAIDQQKEVVQQLNQHVRDSEQFRRADAAGKLIRIATGDGVALAFFTSPDAPVRCAIEVSKAVRNSSAFQLRMGIHSGPVIKLRVGLDPLEQCLWFMKREDVATFRRWIELVRELGLDAGRFVRERQWLAPFAVNIEKILSVFPGLLFDTSKREPFGLRFDSADCFAIDDEEVIDFVTIFHERLANRNPPPSGQIDRAAILEDPATLCQQFVDLFAREFFRAGHKPRKLTEF